MKKLLLLLLFATVLSYTSCGTLNTSGRVKKLEIGMSKNEVISVMGSDYRTVSARQTPDGTLEILLYTSAIDYDYILHLLDGKLVEWNEQLPATPQQHQHDHNHKKE